MQRNSPEGIDPLVFGQGVQLPEAPNIAQEIVPGAGMNVHTDAYSVTRAFATSFLAVLTKLKAGATVTVKS